MFDRIEHEVKVALGMIKDETVTEVINAKETA